MDFIVLTEPGIGRILVRHSEITLIEPTAYCYSRIELSTGVRKIVEESPIAVIAKIKLATELDAEPEHELTPITNQNQNNGSDTNT